MREFTDIQRYYEMRKKGQEKYLYYRNALYVGACYHWGVYILNSKNRLLNIADKKYKFINN